MFSFEEDVSFLRFSTPLREFSRTLVRLFSTSWALAPWYEDITIMKLASNSGNWAMLVLDSENKPRTTNATKMRVVVTGWLTADL